MAGLQLDHPTASEPKPVHGRKPIIVGLYGIPGSGKSTLLKQLEQEVGHEEFAFHDGSQVIDGTVPGGLKAFQAMGKQEQEHWRQRAIGAIGKKCKDSEKVGVVAGHFMLWSEKEQAGESVCTENDLATYTHIIYLDTRPEAIMDQRLGDLERSRESTTVNHLRRWQQQEKDQLRQLCREHHILFLSVSPHPTKLDKVSVMTKVSRLLRDFQYHSEKYNAEYAKIKLDEALGARLGRPETVLVLDADKTLAAQDTGTLFWQMVSDEETLKTLFSGPLRYSYTAFRQATLLYEETANNWEFEGLCQAVAAKVTLHPEFMSLLQKAAELKHVGVIVLTSGLRRVWEKVLETASLSNNVTVIGGGRIADGIVMTGAVKGALVSRLREHHQMYVWAFGDSPLDLDMFKVADQAIVVVGDEQMRSKSMESELTTAMDDGLQARQVLLPRTGSPRLDIAKIPVVELTDEDFLESVLRRRSPGVLIAGDRTSAKLLMTPTRNAELAGPALRTAHRQIGWYLATEFLADVVGLEKYVMPHVLGHTITGYRLAHERQTLIIALMRGGDPMAIGVNDAFPAASLAHAKHPDEIKPQNLEKSRTIILVDSVINTGKSVVEFVRRIREQYASVPIVVVANVVQDQSVLHGEFAQILEQDTKTNLVALRLSTTKFTGSGMTDTGNRLFNTTHLD
ncbi:MAG: hypothetical protein LQ345_006463 [Seirophora villosa]|nr:MAG: hypothetical protein LQ345_006463 [Seirophora villosa]